MVLKCPHCGGYLYYDADSAKMLCPYCYSSFEVSEFGEDAGEALREEAAQAKSSVETAGAGDAQGRPAFDASARRAQATEERFGMPGAGDASAHREAGTEKIGKIPEPDDAAVRPGELAQKDDWAVKENQEETMDTQVYHCTSCGAQLMINDVESATFCAYCGQPTIVLSRVSKMRKPEYILPFTITKEQAYDIIKTRFGTGLYISKEIKNFKPEVLRGIYIPFKIYDIDYYDRQLIKSVFEKKNRVETRYFYREASTRFRRVTADASKNFNDQSSQRLDPYYLKYMKPFQLGYLSGYYADCIDEDDRKMRQTALGRCKELFDEEMMKTVPGKEKGLMINGPQTQILKEEYVMLPVWFLVFSDGLYHHTIMVNGQTGKMVGAVPYDTKMLKISIVSHCVIYSAIAATAFGVLFSRLYFGDELFMLFVLAITGGIGAMIKFVRDRYKAYQKSRNLTSARQIRNLASDRQEDH